MLTGGELDRSEIHRRIDGYAGGVVAGKPGTGVWER